MTFRNIVLLTGLAGLLGGCVVAPDPHYYPAQDAYYDNGYYDDGYYDYHTTPSYEGYYYARIIFLGNIPYYVDDDRHIQPIPPRLYAHFRNYSYRNGPARVPVFSPDREVRDGYPMSRIIYFNDTPYYVGDDRAARPVPNTLRDRFRYAPYQNNAPMYGNRPQPPMIRQNEPRYAPPAEGRDWDRRDPPAFDRDRGRDEPPVYAPGRDRMDPPAYGRGGRDDGGYPANPSGRMMAPPDREDPRPMPILPRQALPAQPPEQRYNGDPHFGAPPSGFGGRTMSPGRDDSRQAPVQQQQPVQPPVQQNSGDSRGGLPFGGRMNPVERPQPGGGNNRAVPDRRKPREDQGNDNGNGRGFGNRRD